MNKKTKSITTKLIFGISFLTIGLLGCLGILTYFQVKKVNAVQFTENLSNSMRLSDTTISAFFKGLDSSVSTFASSKDFVLERKGFDSAAIRDTEKSYLESNNQLVSVMVVSNDSGECIAEPYKNRWNDNPRDASWYTNAVNNDGSTVFSPAYQNSSGDIVFAVSHAIDGEDGNVKGVGMFEVAVSTFGVLLGDQTSMGNIRFILIDSNCTVLLDPFKDELPYETVSDLGIKYLANFSQGNYGIVREKFADGTLNEIRTIPSGNDYYPLDYAMVIPVKAINEGTVNVITSVAILVIAGIILSIIVAILLANGVTRAVKKVTVILKNISEGDGDLTVRLPVFENDEIGQMCGYFNLTIEKIAVSLKSIISESSHMQAIAQTLSGNMSSAAGAVNQISANIESVKAEAGNQSAGVEQTSATMHEIASNIEKLNQNIMAQSETVVQSSASIEEMVANIRSVSAILEKNAVNVQQLAESAENGRTIVAKSVEMTAKISADSDGLIETSTMIQNIANQTNLLAMNAAIEAAHAGDAGKGFAVVADEIRKLAEDSNAQGKKIGDVLQRLRDLIVSMTSGAEEIQKQFDVIFEHTKTVTTQENVIKSAMDEQTQGGKQVLDSIHQINSITSDVKDSAGVMEKGSKEVLAEMEKLASVTEQINGAMNEIASGVGEINNSMQEVNNVTHENSESIGIVTQEIGKFKVE